MAKAQLEWFFKPLVKWKSTSWDITIPYTFAESHLGFTVYSNSAGRGS